MTAPMHADAGARALDALPPAEAAAFDDHVAGCEPCAAEYAELLATTALLAAAVAEPPPDGLRAKVLRAAARTPQLPPLTPGGDTPGGQPNEEAGPAGRHRRTVPQWRRPVLLVAASIVAAALMAVGVILATRSGGPSPDQAAAQCVAAAHDAKVHHPSVGSQGSVTLARSCDAAVVQLVAMPKPPPGKAYQLWLLVGSTARSAGMVAAQTGPSGTIVLTHLSPSDTGVAVSLEPAGGSTAPTTTPVWVTPLNS